jgi:hypothetical protein
MLEDLLTASWSTRAWTRWGAYTALWTGLVVFGTVSDMHSAWNLVAAALGFAAAAMLLLTFLTLFERTSARGDIGAWPLLAVPWAGAGAVAVGTFALLKAGPYLATVVSTETLNSAADVVRRYDVTTKSTWPRVVCLTHAFVRTDWEAGKLECSEKGAVGHEHVVCVESFSAAPIFRSRDEALLGAADNVHVWALSRGPHVDASYREDGTLCGFLSGPPIEYALEQYRFAVSQVISHQNLQVPVESTPLEARPMLVVGEPNEYTVEAQFYLGIATILLFFWPCAGPVPLSLFFFWISLYRTRQVSRLRPLDNPPPHHTLPSSRAHDHFQHLTASE